MIIAGPRTIYLPGQLIRHQRKRGGAPAPSSLLTGLLEYFPLNEGAGGTSASATSATVLTLTGATWTTGGVNDDAVVDITSAIIVSDTTYTLGTGAWALSIWIKTTATNATNTNNVFFGLGPATGATAGTRIALTATNGVVYGLLTSNSFSTSGGAAVNSGNWTHIVVSKAAGGTVSSFTVWVNGVQQTLTLSGASTINPGAYPLNLSQQAAGTKSLAGSIDEVGMWSRELTAGEVAELYNGGSGRYYPFS